MQPLACKIVSGFFFQLPTGTYYFIINLNEDNSKPLTGYVTVIR